MSSKPFSVIKFNIDNTVDWVPTAWNLKSSDKLTVQFPKIRTLKTDELKRDSSSNPKQSWPQWEIEVIKSYDTVGKAERKAQKYVETSDIESSSKENGTPKRQKVSGDAAGTELISTVPQTPLFVAAAALQRDVIVQNLEPPPDHQPTAVVTEVNIGASTVQDPTFIVSTCANEETLQLILKEQRAFQEKSLENQDVIIREQKEIKTLLLNVLAKPQVDNGTEDRFFFLIPLKSLHDLEEFESTLQVTENFDKLVNALDRFGRLNLSQTIGDILSFLFEHQFSTSVRYTSGSQKIPFGEKKLADAVRAVARKNHPVAKEKEINDRIGIWFRGSVDRGGGRKARNGNSKKNGEKASSAVSSVGSGEDPDANS